MSPGDDIAGTTADLYLVTPGRPPRIRLVIAGVQVVGSSTADGAMVATLRVSSGDVAALIEAESSGGLRLAGRPL
jgi:phytoene dehydrogenase-like protein